MLVSRGFLLIGEAVPKFYRTHGRRMVAVAGKAVLMLENRLEHRLLPLPTPYGGRMLYVMGQSSSTFHH